MSVSHAWFAVSSVRAMLASVSDPRDPRGVRHRLVAVLGVAVVSTLAGAANYRESGSVAADLPQELLRLLGGRWDPARQRFIAPSAGTLRRVLIALDGKDLRGSWNDSGRLVLFSAMVHRRDDGTGSTGVVFGQIAVPDGTTETTQVRALLDPLHIAGALVSADAAHTCAAHDGYLVEDKDADYLMTIKGNRSSLRTAAIATARELIAAPPQDVPQRRGHGRINRWTTWTTCIDDDFGLPHATRLALIRRNVADLTGQPLSKEIVFVATSRAALTAAEISRHTRRHWGIENLEHRPRDTIRREDDQQAHLGNGPRAMATFRNLALGLCCLHGITKIKLTVQSIGRNPPRTLPLIT